VRLAATPSRDLADDLAVRAALNEALGKLPKRQREVVALRYLADLTESDTASVLGLTVGSVKQHAHRALQAMRERLGNDATFGWEE
jgi:RNA polymerase sigma factor (sigma-70 family)